MAPTLSLRRPAPARHTTRLARLSCPLAGPLRRTFRARARARRLARHFGYALVVLAAAWACGHKPPASQVSLGVSLAGVFLA